MTTNADTQKDDAKSYGLKLYASAITAQRPGRVGFNVYLVRAAGLKIACGSALDDAAERWPRNEGWYDHQETTMEVPQHLLSNPSIKEQRS